MYEDPKLIRVGKVGDVVMGATPVGADIDGTWMVSDSEFAEEVMIELLLSL
jgi:hypothetical protein